MEVLLLHIPKTAGSSVKGILIDQKVKYKELHLNRRLECAPVKYIDDILNDPEIKVILTWRHPVEHVLSSFYFYKQYKHFNYPDILDDFINSETNQQSMFLFKTNFLEHVDIDLDKILK